MRHLIWQALKFLRVASDTTQVVFKYRAYYRCVGSGQTPFSSPAAFTAYVSSRSYLFGRIVRHRWLDIVGQASMIHGEQVFSKEIEGVEMVFSNNFPKAKALLDDFLKEVRIQRVLASNQEDRDIGYESAWIRV